MHRCKQINTDDVQFDFYNTTGSPIAIDLFSLLGPIIPDNPAIAPSNTIVNTLASGFTTTIFDPVGNRIFVPDGTFSDNVVVLDASTGLLQTTIALAPGSNPEYCVIDTTQNYLYVSEQGLNQVSVFDLSAPLLPLVTTIAIPNQPGFLVYSSGQQKVYCIDTAFPIQVIDATTNTLLPSIINPINATRGVYVPTTDQIWILGTNPSPTTRQIDSATDTFLPGSQSYGGVATEMLYNSATNQVYLVGSNFYALNVSPISITCTIILGFALGSGIGIDTNTGYVYCFDVSTDLVRVVDPSTCSIVSSFNSGFIPGSSTIVAFNPANDYFFIPSTFTNQTATFSVAPAPTNAVYYTGTSDYNAFVRDLQDNPIRVAEIRILANNQNQFDNPLNVKITDANGVSSDHPRFPFIDLRIFQFQSRLVVLEFDKVPLIFNGREFFSQYILNPNEKVIFVIKYWQKWKKCITDNDFYNPTIYRFNDIK